MRHLLGFLNFMVSNKRVEELALVSNDPSDIKPDVFQFDELINKYPNLKILSMRSDQQNNVLETFSVMVAYKKEARNAELNITNLKVEGFGNTQKEFSVSTKPSRLPQTSSTSISLSSELLLGTWTDLT